MKITPCPYTHEELKSAWEKGYKKETYVPPTEVARKAYEQGKTSHQKDTFLIPRGYYCYQITGPMENGKLPIRCCPYLTSEEKTFDNNGVMEKFTVGVCSWLKQQATKEELEDPYFAEVMDQVKECGEKYHD